MIFNRGLIVDGRYFDIPMISLKREAPFLDKFAERVETGDLERELIGVYYNFTLSAGSSDDFGDTDYEDFWDFMTAPIDFREFSLPLKKGYYSFRGYITNISDEYEKILEEDAVFKGFTCKMIAKSPARTP